MSVLGGSGRQRRHYRYQGAQHGESQGIGTVVTDDGSEFQQQLIGMTDASGIQANQRRHHVIQRREDTPSRLPLTHTPWPPGGTVEAEVYEAPANLTDDVLAQYYPGASFTDVAGGKVSDAGTVVYASGTGMMGPVPVAVFFDAGDSIMRRHCRHFRRDSGLRPAARRGRVYGQLHRRLPSGSEVDGVSGATITSDAIKGAVDIAHRQSPDCKGGGLR